jgi:hypothetical protein
MCRKPGSVMCATDRASNETRLHSPQHRNRRTYRPCTTRQRASGSSRRCERWPRGRPPFVPAPCSRPFASLTRFARTAGNSMPGVASPNSSVHSWREAGKSPWCRESCLPRDASLPRLCSASALRSARRSYRVESRERALDRDGPRRDAPYDSRGGLSGGAFAGSPQGSSAPRGVIGHDRVRAQPRG